MNFSGMTRGNVKQAVPFLWVSDIVASVRYYVDGLGFEMSKRWLHEGKLRWCWLRSGDAGLMLQEFWKEGPHANVPASRLGVGVSLCFICDDALSIYRQITARGINADRPFVGNGMWVCSLVDPDGYQLCFESPTDAPEELEFTEDRASPPN